MTETERKLDLLLGDALAENETYRKANEHLVSATSAALAENERLRRELKYQDARENHIGTHGPDCWSYGPKHYECALQHINSITDDGK